MNRALLIRAVILAFLLLGVSALLVDWQGIIRIDATRHTDDAVVAGDPIRLAAEVAGYVARVPVTDFQHVHAGELLFAIADEDYQARVRRAAADVALATATVAAAEAGIDLATAQLGVAEATIQATDADLERARRELRRQDLLVHTEAGSPRDWETATSAARRATATLAGNRRGLDADRAQIEVMKAGLEQQRALLTARQATLDLAKIDLGHTRIVAPVDGVVTARLVRPGAYVPPGTALITLVPATPTWIVANYREDQLTAVRVGQPAVAQVDARPGVRFRGHVDSIGPTSEARSSLLPPDRAVGSFTKIEQRVPVKIVLEPGQAGADALQPGLSAEVSIDTAGSGSP